MKKDLKEFISNIDNARRQEDSMTLIELMEEESGYRAYLDGSIVGFGQYHYRYESGREGDAIVVGFSPRKQNMAVYIMPGFSKYTDLLEKLGKHKIGKSCLYINKLVDIDEKVLRRLVKKSVKDMQKKYDCKET